MRIVRPPEATVRSIDKPRLLAPDAAGIAVAAGLLRAGGLVAVPTETVYGLGADASSSTGVARIFVAKGRPVDHPVIVHLGQVDQLDEWALDVPAVARALAAAFWPGPLTLILRRRSHVLDSVTGGQDTVGLRVPGHPVALALLAAFGGGIAAPSANRFGRVSPTDHRHVVADLAAYLDPSRDAILAGGACTVGVESTIVDCSRGEPIVLRPGGITAEQLEPILGHNRTNAAREFARTVLQGEGPPTAGVRAPGMLDAHYAPAAAIEVADGGALIARLSALEGRRVGVLGPRHLAFPMNVIRMDAPDPYTGATLAPLLYARFRDADALGLEVLLVVPPNEEGLGVAVRDRLRRAAFGSVPI